MSNKIGSLHEAKGVFSEKQTVTINLTKEEPVQSEATPKGKENVKNNAIKVAEAPHVNVSKPQSSGTSESQLVINTSDDDMPLFLEENVQVDESALQEIKGMHEAQQESSLEMSVGERVERSFVDVKLTSVLFLRGKIEANVDKQLKAYLSNHVFVGFVDHTYALIQSGTYLIMVNYLELS
jgi:hypothetical protein